MDRFHVVEDAAVIVRKAGVYKQVKVYVRGTALYAGPERRLRPPVQGRRNGRARRVVG
jgi:hypothetical protein